jgi:hypothetical protein
MNQIVSKLISRDASPMGNRKHIRESIDTMKIQ